MSLSDQANTAVEMLNTFGTSYLSFWERSVA